MINDIYLKKKALRKLIRKLKKELTPELRKIKSDSIMNKIEDDVHFQNAETVFICWAMDDEVDTRDLIIRWSDRKIFILPSIDGDDLILKRFTGINCLKNGDLYDIPEPSGEPFEDISGIELAIIPGVAFDKNNNRMGRGKAYYDKILLQMKNKTFLLGICYDFQFIDSVPVETHDMLMDKVVYS
ncbi:MAG: 5-formyltetrahydrofolate cyclo-ligase [Candidatus Delongbacteria bacterium]|nr:5-formyltetrahydrofolate cyclo-ligase [Candidatus Delongbacteria bacterium]